MAGTEGMRVEKIGKGTEGIKKTLAFFLSRTGSYWRIWSVEQHNQPSVLKRSLRLIS